MSHDIKPPLLFEFSVKPKVLYVADLPYWKQDTKGQLYQKYLPEFDIDIGYSRQNTSPYWEDMLKEKHYDVICCNNIPNVSPHQTAKYVPVNFSPRFNSYYEDLLSFIREQNRAGTQVVLTQDEADRQDIRRYAAFNAIAVNNPRAYKDFIQAGFRGVYRTYDGIDLSVFGPDIPIQKRQFKVFFTSSVMHPEQKGTPIWEEVKLALQDEPDIAFEELITDSFVTKTPEQLNELYNSCKIYVSFAFSEGGSCDLLRAAACGLVPIIFKTEYCDYFKNILLIDRTATLCAEKIRYLHENQDILEKMSQGISKEILPWDMRLMARHWGHFIQKVVMKKKAVQF